MAKAQREDEFIEAVRGMLRRPDYLIPLAAAERQFRDHYYGLNAAALLEDVFYDALGNFLRQTQPATGWTRPKAGQKGWDYAFDGLQISHKVSQKLGKIAALWDATKEDFTKWSADEPIVYVLGRNTPSTGLTVTVQGHQAIKCRSVADLDHQYLADGRLLLVVNWPADSGHGMLLDVVETEPGQSAAEALPFSRVWHHVARHVSSGGAANDVDVLATTIRSPRGLRPIRKALITAAPGPIEIGAGFRAGVYLLAKHNLQGLALTKNNRGVLIGEDSVKKALRGASRDGHFSPLPTWYWLFAEDRPPDMYSAQRVEYEARFSARGELDMK